MSVAAAGWQVAIAAAQPPDAKLYEGNVPAYSSDYRGYLGLLSQIVRGLASDCSIGFGGLVASATDCGPIRVGGDGEVRSDDGKEQLRWGKVASVPQVSEGFGKNHARNVAKRERRKREEKKKKKRDYIESVDWRGGGVSHCATTSGRQDVKIGSESGPECALRDAIVKQKVVESALAAKRAELALARASDPVMSDLYNQQLKAKMLCGMNQATVRSEKSLESLKTVSPGSSATPGEIRAALLYSETWKAKEKAIKGWVASGAKDVKELNLLLEDDKVDDDSSLAYWRMKAEEAEAENEDLEAFAASFKNGYMTSDEITAEEKKVADAYDDNIRLARSMFK